MRHGGSSSTKVSAALREILTESLEDDLIVTPAYNEWLGRNPEGVVDPEVAAQMARFMSTPDRVRSGSFSASSAGYCLRRQELSYLGVKSPVLFPQRTHRIFNNGKWVHLRWQAQLLTAGIIDQAESVIKKASQRARCTLDGLGIASQGRYKGYDFGLEIKGRNDYTYQEQLKKDPDEKTRRQVGFQFLLSGFDVISILNENKNTQDFKEWVIYRDDEMVEEAALELADLNRAIERGKLHPMIPECKVQGKEFDTCPFGGVGGPCVMSGTWPTSL